MSKRSKIGLGFLSILLIASCNDPNPVPNADSSVDRSVRDQAMVDKAIVDQAMVDQARQDLSSQDRLLVDVAVADGTSTNCPTNIPSGTCSVATYPRTCWYGDDLRWFCRTSAYCDQSGTWQIKEPLSGCQGPLPANCPADPTTTYDGCNADGGPDPVCVYSDQYCQCRFGGGPNSVWGCVHVPAGCPVLPPEEGDICSEAMECNYYPCMKSASCDQGFWHWENMFC